MADLNTNTPPDGGEPKQPETLTLKHRGKEIKVSPEKAIELAQKGFDYDTRSAELNGEREAMQQNATRYKEFETLRDLIDSNPTLGKAVAASIEDPQSVINALSRSNQSGDGFDFDDDVSTPTPGKASPEVISLQRTVQNLQSRLDQRDGADQASAMEKQVGRELDAYPWMTGAARSRATRDIVRDLQETPGSSLSGLAAVVANEFHDIIKGEKQEKVEQQQQRNGLRAAPQQRGVPIPKLPDKIDKASFKDGSLHKALLKSASAFGIGDS